MLFLLWLLLTVNKKKYIVNEVFIVYKLLIIITVIFFKNHYIFTRNENLKILNLILVFKIK